MLSLSDPQLAAVMVAASALPPEKRSLFLQRVAARLALCGNFNDADLDTAVHLALKGLIQESAA